MTPDLRDLSARLGANPLLVQAAGGNTSIKQDGVMWIKASGTWLRDAMLQDIFVPLDLVALSRALAEDHPDCESCLPFVRQDINARGLRPSIETSVHGLMPQAVVLHVHCVNTIAHAICVDAELRLQRRLSAFNWGFVPYARPGLHLSRAIRGVLKPGMDVLVLQNHGLVVAADTVAAAEALLNRVVAALELPRRQIRGPRVDQLLALAGDDYRLPDDAAAHDFALEGCSYGIGASLVFYPDHAVFLGTNIPSSTASGAVAVAIEGAGVLVRRDAKPSIEPMLRCLGDVLLRLEKGTSAKALTLLELDQLLNWDAEKYRQQLKA